MLNKKLLLLIFWPYISTSNKETKPNYGFSIIRLMPQSYHWSIEIKLAFTICEILWTRDDPDIINIGIIFLLYMQRSSLYYAVPMIYALCNCYLLEPQSCVIVYYLISEHCFPVYRNAVFFFLIVYSICWWYDELSQEDKEWNFAQLFFLAFALADKTYLLWILRGFIVSGIGYQLHEWANSGTKGLKYGDTISAINLIVAFGIYMNFWGIILACLICGNMMYYVYLRDENDQDRLSFVLIIVLAIIYSNFYEWMITVTLIFTLCVLALDLYSLRPREKYRFNKAIFCDMMAIAHLFTYIYFNSTFAIIIYSNYAMISFYCIFLIKYELSKLPALCRALSTEEDIGNLNKQLLRIAVLSENMYYGIYLYLI